MNQSVNSRIVESLSQLEATIKSAREKLNAIADVDRAVVERLDCYLEVVTRQRILSTQLASAIKHKAWDETKRLAELIRQSSYMIAIDTSSLASIIESGRVEKSDRNRPDYN